MRRTGLWIAALAVLPLSVGAQEKAEPPAGVTVYNRIADL
ncbi:unnamed protein product, partial [marine sediment metagenome]